MLISNSIILADIENVSKADLPWEDLYGKTILVTGANGFLPAYIVRTLLYINDQNAKASIKVIGLVRNIDKANKRFTDYLKRSDFHIIQADISKHLEIEDAIDVIIHAASQASPKYYAIDPVGTLSANTIGTFHLLQLGVEKSVEKFLYFSSSEVYGSLEDGENITEDKYGVLDPANVRSCYAESKRMGETMCVSFGAQYNIPVVIARPFHTYGPGLSLDDGRVFADFVSNIIYSQDIVMNSDGSAVRSFCYLADATKGFFTVLLKGENGQAYNVGNPKQAISIKELAKILVDLYPDRKLKAVFKESDPTKYLASTFNKLSPSIEKINLLGWKPETSVQDGFKRTIESFEQ